MVNHEQAWRISMHGGHSTESSAHGRSPLRAILDRAVALGLVTYGVSQHAPVSDARFLYDDERAAGLDLAGRTAQFEAYAAASAVAVRDYADRLEVLRGFEAEVVPRATYVAEAQHLRQRFHFDYVVGSVHWVNDNPIDVSPELFRQAVDQAGGLTALLVRYYRTVIEMVETLRPEVVGHFDLPRLFSGHEPAHREPPVLVARDEALAAVAASGALLEVNTAAYRKGLGGPYPAPDVIARADALGVRFTLSDDSHHVDDVGAGLEAARACLLSEGVGAIVSLGRALDGSIERREIPL